jgi:putative solute:sodium symporter small subunit
MATDTTHGGARTRDRTGEDGVGYWKANVRMIKWSLAIWALCSFGFGILLRPLLKGIEVGGTDLGFWFAQQGSILVFLALILFYAWRMNKLDKQYGVEE